MTILNNYSDVELQFILDSSTSFRNFLLRVGAYSTSSAAYDSAKKDVNKRGLKIPTYDSSKEIVNRFKNKIPENELFVENSKASRNVIKRKIIRENLIEYKCKKCGIKNIWQNEEITLELEHINGINNDNRLENLCFLCPNCHSQTITNSGRNIKYAKKKYYCKCGSEIWKNSKECFECYKKTIKRKVENRPKLETLLKEVENYGYSKTGKKYNVSDNTIRKWIKQYTKIGM